MAGLLPFTISDTDFKLPAETITVLEKAVHKGVFGYTRWNHHAFKSSVTHWFQTRFKAATQEDWVVYSPSVIYSLSALLPIVSSPQDKVMTFTPCYDAFFATIRDNDRELVEFPLTDTNHRYTIDFEKLEKAFQSEKNHDIPIMQPTQSNWQSMDTSGVDETDCVMCGIPSFPDQR